MVPTKDRSTFSIALQYEGETILIDCGEGTQRQLRKANLHPANVDKILITHWHGDHVLGLPGLIQSASASVQDKVIEIYGPKGTKRYLKQMLTMFHHRNTLRIKVTEITKKIETNKYIIETARMDHPASCLAYSFKEKDRRKINLDYTKKFGLKQHPLLGQLQKGKTITFNGKKITPEKATIVKPGKKITFILDTKLCQNAIKIAKDSDLLVCESTFSKEEEKLAHEYKHLTSTEAATIAKKAKAKELVLAHFSQRYPDIKPLEKEAKKVFPKTKAVKDLEVISF